MDTPTPDTPVIDAPAPSPAPSPAPADPFAVDETVLATLSPESRTAVDSTLSTWRKTAEDRLSKEREGLKQYEEESKALRKLASDPKFQEWYRDQTNPKPKAEPQKEPVSSQEWQEALAEAASGNPAKWVSLNKKMMEPEVTSLANQQRELALSVELNDLLQKHPEAKQLYENKFLDPFVHYYTDMGGQPMEVAFKKAHEMWQAALAEAKKAAVGMVADKKASVTEGAPTSGPTESVIYVDTPEQAYREQIRAVASGRNVTYAVKRK